MSLTYFRRTSFAALGFVVLVATVHGQDNATPKPAGEKYALLVGVTRYVAKEFRPLPYAERDVSELAKVLRESGYRPDNVVVLTQTAGAEDPRFAPLADRIKEELKLLMRNRAENDSLLIAFAGHGVHFKNDADSYFCPADVNLEERKNLVSLTALYKELEKCPANMKVLMVDACRNDPFQDKSRRASAELDSVTRPALPTTPGGIVAFFSCSEKEQAFEHDELKHGVFFHFVIEALRKGVGDQNEITAPALGDFVSRKVSDFVRAKYGKAQTPEMVGKLRGLAPLVSIDEAIKSLRRGRQHLKNFECDQAIAAFSDALDRNDQLAPAYFSRAESNYYRGEYDKALADYNAALRLEPDNLKAKAYRGLIWIEKSEWDKARADFVEVQRVIKPTDAEGFYLRGLTETGLVHLNTGDNDKAIADYSEAIKLDPAMEDAYVDRAGALSRKSEYEKVIADCHEVLKLNPRNAIAYGHQAYAYEQQEDYDRAIADNTESLRLNPRSMSVLANRGSCYLEKGERDKAIADLSEAIRMSPNFGYARAKRGRAYEESSQHDKAIVDFDEAIKAEFKEAWVYAFRGDAWYYKKDFDKAISDYGDAIQMDADYVKPLQERAYTYIMQKSMYDKGLADAEAGLRLDPENPSLHNLKGLALDGKEAYDRAIAAYDAAIKLKPDVATYHSNKGLANIARGQPEQGIDDFTVAIRLEPDKADGYYNRGKAYSRTVSKLTPEVERLIKAKDAVGAERLLQRVRLLQEKATDDVATAERLAKKK